MYDVPISVTEAEYLKMMALAASRRPFLAAEEFERRRRNTATLSDQAFLDGCEKAGIPPTRRQASKFENGKGAAFRAAALIRVEKRWNDEML